MHDASDRDERGYPADDLELLRWHVEAVWGIPLPPLSFGDLRLAAEAAPAEWTAYLARLVMPGGYTQETEDGAEDVDSEMDAEAEAEVRLWHPKVQPVLYPTLADGLRTILDAPVEQPIPGAQREVVLIQRVPPRLSLEDARQRTRPLTADDAALLEAFEAGSAAYYADPRVAPVIGVEVDGKLASIAHSSRRTERACELGITTRQDARGQGYGLAATVAWAAAVAEEGLIPLYSAYLENGPSLALAAAAGFVPFAFAVYLLQT